MRADHEGRSGTIASTEQILAPQASLGAGERCAVRLLKLGPSVRPKAQSSGRGRGRRVWQHLRSGLCVPSLSGEDLLLHQQVAGGFHATMRGNPAGRPTSAAKRLDLVGLYEVPLSSH